MNSAASGYPSHSYYSPGGALSANHGASAASTSWTQNHGIPGMFSDYYGNGIAVPDYYPGYPTVASRYATSSTGTPSPRSFDSSTYWPTPSDQFYSQLAGNSSYGTYASTGGKKRGVANSKKERRRTISINGAFSNLRDCIPNVPKDTKLSKIKTLRLACGYIQHLMDALDSDSAVPVKEFKADLSRKTPCRAEKRKCIEEEIAAAAERKSRGRSGWPQTIWAQDLKVEVTTPTYPSNPPPLVAYSQTLLPEESSNSLRTKPHLVDHSMDIIHPSPSCASSMCEESSSASDIASSL